MRCWHDEGDQKSFDPYNLFNPGKLLPDGRYEIDENLRLAREAN